MSSNSKISGGGWTAVLWDAHVLLLGLLENLVEHQPSDKDWQSKEAGCVVRMLLALRRKEAG